MKIFLYLVAGFVSFLTLTPAEAQRGGGERGKVEVCAADDPRCQKRGVVALGCSVDGDQYRKVNQWRASGDALRVHNGRWSIFFARRGDVKNCSEVLVVHGSNPSRDRPSKARFCSGEDANCQRPNAVGLSCLLEGAVDKTSNWQYTGDAMRVVRGQWMMYYSHNNETYICENVVVADVARKKRRNKDGYQMCSGNDQKCQREDLIALSCDIDGSEFSSPKKWHYNGRAMRVKNGQWISRFGNGKTFNCKNIVVAKLGEEDNVDEGGAVLPSGAVILFDDVRCPENWTRIGEVRGRRSDVAGMSYCRLD